MNEKSCSIQPREPLSSIANSLIEINRNIENEIEVINSKLFGHKPCDETNSSTINDLESALNFIRSRMETIAKDVYSINERL